jgi:cytosine/adenosine deaminase-related metal-dependent hydrolase
MIIRAKVVVTADSPPINNGAVLVAGEKIVDLGEFPDVSRRHAKEEIVDLGEQALLPGLINAHCHLDYTCLRGKIPRQKSFTDWIRAINAEKAKLSADDYVRSIYEGFIEAKRFGTTTIANLTGFPELVSQVDPPIRTWWFAELIDVRDPTRANEIVDLAVAQLKSQPHWGLAPHALFTASGGLYRRCEEVASREDILLTTHLAESREEMSMFGDARGALYDFLKGIGREMSDCSDETPIEKFLVERVTRIDRTYLLVHLNEMTETDFELFAASRGEFSVVHCPRSHAYFGHSPFQFEKLRELGLNICLGTDSLASNEDLSLFAEMRAFQKEFPDVSPEKIWEMVTVNPARALRQGRVLGKISAGYLADLIAIPVAKSTSIFAEIISFDGPVAWRMIGGRISA